MQRHDCVILPGIGAFIASYKPAYINSEWGIITPPRREIYFNSSITNNDGLIANSISRKERISFSEASQILQEKSILLKKTLSTQGEITIGHIGTLHYGEDATISFEPFKNSSKSQNRNGFDTICLKTLSQLNSQKFTPNTSRNKNFKNDKNYYIPINKKVVHYAAMLIVVFMAAFSLSMPNVGTSTHQDYASVIPVKTITTTKTVEKNIDTNIQINSISDSLTITDNAEYYLIVASLKDDDTCKKFIDQTSTDFVLKIISSPTISRVYAAKSNNKEELMTIQQSNNFKKQFSQAWIWHKK